MLKLLLLPFKMVGGVFSLLSKIFKFLTSNVLGSLIVATIGFMLGMKYLEYRRKQEGDNPPQ